MIQSIMIQHAFKTKGRPGSSSVESKCIEDQRKSSRRWTCNRECLEVKKVFGQKPIHGQPISGIRKCSDKIST